jgi:MFS family permease
MTRDLGIVAASMFIWGIGEGMFFYFQPLYLVELGADPLVIGAILGANGLAMMLVQAPVGYLSDRFGRRKFLWVSWFLGAAATAVMAAAVSLPVFVIGMLMYGLTYFVMSPLNSYVTAARGRWRPGQAIMLISGAFNLGMAFGALGGGQIANALGLRQIFFGALVLFVIATGLILFIRRQPVEPHSSRDGSSRAFLRSPRYLAYLSAVFLAFFATYLPQPLSQNFLFQYRSLDYGQIGQLVAFTGLGVGVLNLVLGRFGERLGFIAAQAAVGGFALLLWHGAGLPWYAAGYFLLGGFKTTRSLAVAQTRAFIPDGRMGLAYGITETMGAMAMMAAPVLAGYLYTQNPIWIYSVSVVFLLVSMTAGLIFSPAQPLSLTPALSPKEP